VKTGASSHWAWTGYCADHRDTRQQAQRAYEAFTRYDDNLARHIYLLQAINEALFYKLVTDHAEEMLRSCAPDDRQAVLYTAIGPGPGQPARVVTGATGRPERDRGSDPPGTGTWPPGQAGHMQNVIPLSVRKD